MPDFEDQLRHALARQEPPPGFAARIAVRVKRRSSGRNFWKPWAAGLIAASLLAGACGIQQFEQRRDREKGQAARAQLLQALQITSSKLQRIQKKMESAYQ
ncbi:MAG: hypothetical protein ACR2NN_06470 [Bryobacteraceae bacterium]